MAPTKELADAAADATVENKSKKDKKEKKDKKDKKEKKDKSDKTKEGRVDKESKDKKKASKKAEKLAKILAAQAVGDGKSSAPKTDEEKAAAEKAALKKLADDEKNENKAREKARIEGAVSELVVFAKPLADDVTENAVFELAKKAHTVHRISRGVKEVEKNIRKLKEAYDQRKVQKIDMDEGTGKKDTDRKKSALVVIAADSWPEEIVMHFPYACEEADIAYIFVKSRVRLGDYAGTKRACSVVLLLRDQRSKSDGKGGWVSVPPTKKIDGKVTEIKVDATDYEKKFDAVAKVATQMWNDKVLPYVRGDEMTMEEILADDEGKLPADV